MSQKEHQHTVLGVMTTVCVAVRVVEVPNDAVLTPRWALEE